MAVENRQAEASLDTLHRIFTVPEAPDSTLGRIEKEISENLNAFLQTHIAAQEKPLTEIEKDFSCASVPEQPSFVSD
ncbi:MAG: putative pyridoxal-dependent aspartate 1-decarboxylase, partial [Photobacterium halotolerans]